MTQPKPKIGILTISDRASRGQYEDQSGPAIEQVLREYLATACDYEIRMVPVGERRAVGMGEVWLAEQTAPVRRRVALKLTEFGLASAEQSAGFDLEPQALAMMNHEAIAATGLALDLWRHLDHEPVAAGRRGPDMLPPDPCCPRSPPP